ncbi:hypothetical protein DFJ58DRAFT_737470 [Suillus subalutaceus]|uniref:uncharacterized protein n=1 Tax=Suillus subalutaceus TaxID=48586 RepID=UPI001B86255D|nr:uncharacterized protein DFJ58DRAFT_737470 [Suillus subalutaceus]KAG1829217.1 hypothetical protein DFJ58DRAFT_737470 [Suillus subalutaceus]
MKVFPNFGKEQTFSLSELASALDLIRTQNAIMDAHNEDGDTLYLTEELLSGHCPTCGTYFQYQPSPADAVSSYAPSASPATQTTDAIPVTLTVATAPVPQTAVVGAAATVTGMTPPAAPATQTAAVGPTPPTVTTAPVPQTAVVGAAAAVTPAGATGTSTSTSTSMCWYVVTVGLRNWRLPRLVCTLQFGLIENFNIITRHNVHPHVIGIPGACFGHHSSLAAAQAAYAEAVNDGGVVEVPL